MAHTRVLLLLCHLRYRSSMDDLCPGATQFQCVLLYRVSASMSALFDPIFFTETHPNYVLYRHRLASGWFPGTEIVSLCLELSQAVILRHISGWHGRACANLISYPTLMVA
jgi:hypothetical protein